MCRLKSIQDCEIFKSITLLKETWTTRCFSVKCKGVKTSNSFLRETESNLNSVIRLPLTMRTWYVDWGSFALENNIHGGVVDQVCGLLTLSHLQTHSETVAADDF